jgi:ribonuclease III
MPSPELPHSFADPSLLELALTHSSTGRALDNERLEFLGDAILDLVVAEDLYDHLPDVPEGVLTELKAYVVSRVTLAEAARRMGIERHVRLGPGLRERALPRSVLANLYEAVLGAVYLDGGLEASRGFVLATLAEPLEEVRAQRLDNNPKQALQQICQRRWGRPPVYAVLEQRGQSHARAYRVAAEISERRFPCAWGRTLKEAERWAALEALIALEEAALEEAVLDEGARTSGVPRARRAGANGRRGGEAPGRAGA